MRRFPITLLWLCVIGGIVDGCTSDLNCSLNGLCNLQQVCMCDSPWTGAACTQLAFNITPASAKNLYKSSDRRNTWNGPIVTAPDGNFHIYVPIYLVGSLSGPTSIKHGIASVITGPWDWTTYQDVPTEGGENPAFVVLLDPLHFELPLLGTLILSLGFTDLYPHLHHICRFFRTRRAASWCTRFGLVV